MNYAVMGRRAFIPIITGEGSHHEVRYDSDTDTYTADDICYVTRHYLLNAWRESRGRVNPYQGAPIKGSTLFRFAVDLWIPASAFQPLLAVGAQMRRRIPEILRCSR